ncbi:MAG: D-alanyl-D-alanine carboxypeptidase family protein [Pseudomonadota bacterium]
MAKFWGSFSFKSTLAMLAFTVASTATPASAEKYASIVIDMETDEVLHARHADEPRYPASLTKAMTLYMLFDAMKSGEVKLNERLPVSRHAASQPPSALRLKVGSTISVKDAINALVTKSANDVAVVVAERLGGTESRFATLMTAKARSMGMTKTTFRNASGLPDDQQLSTARDMAELAERLLIDHADYYGYFANTRFSWGKANYKNHNRLIGKVEGVDGIKTGYTRASGFNLMASAKRRGRRVVAIMFGGSTSRSRDQHVADLIEAAYLSFEDLEEETPALRTRQTFASIQAPVDPNSAAMPMLNGKVFGPVAQGDEGSKSE